MNDVMTRTTLEQLHQANIDRLGMAVLVHALRAENARLRRQGEGLAERLAALDRLLARWDER